MKDKLLSWIHQKPMAAWSVLVFMLAFCVYANTISHEYAWDDEIVILQNDRVKAGFSGIPAHFEFRKRIKLQDFSGYRPVTMSSFSIDVGLFGLNPTMGHLMNVLWFALLCVVLFRTIRRLFPGFHAVFAFLATLLFLVHPIHVEAVANIKSRDEIFALLFSLWALNSFVRHHRSGNWGHLALSGLFLLLGIWSKENALTFFLVLPLAVITLLHGSVLKKTFSIAKVALLAIFVAGSFWMVTGNLPGTAAEVAPEGYLESQLLGNCLSVKMHNWDRIGNTTMTFWRYTSKFFYPHPLAYYSGYNQWPIHSWLGPKLIPPWLFTTLPLLLGLFLLIRRRWLHGVFALLSYYCTVFIYLHFPGLILSDTLAERFLMMPSAGLCLLVVMVLYRVFRLDLASNPFQNRAKSGMKAPKKRQTREYIFPGLMAAVCLCLLVMTVRRNTVWKDNLTLFSADVETLEDCSRAHYFLGTELARQYDPQSGDLQAEEKIISEYERAISITGEAYYAIRDLGEKLLAYGRYARAEELLRWSLRKYADQSDIQYFLGKARYHLGKYAAAAKNLKISKDKDPQLAENWEYLARAYERSGQYENAFAVLNAGMQRFPEYVFFHDVYSDAYFDSGDTTASFRPIFRLLEIEPENQVWWTKLIGRYQIIGDQQNAARYYQEAVTRGILQ